MSVADSNIVIITGPESVGKTTLVTSLADYYNSISQPEYARDYITDLNRAYNYSDIEKIAEVQVKELYQKKKEAGKKKIFIDTYLIITKIWFVWFAGKYPDWIDDEITKTNRALYLLCSPDIEWYPDNVRENGGEARNKLFTEYEKELRKFNLNYRIIKGAGNERFDMARAFVDEYFQINK